MIITNTVERIITHAFLGGVFKTQGVRPTAKQYRLDGRHCGCGRCAQYNRLALNPFTSCDTAEKYKLFENKLYAHPFCRPKNNNNNT